MRRKSRASTETGGIVCPFCEMGEVEVGRPDPRCSSCDRAVGGMLRTLREIVALPDALGRHACECGHPEMRLLPDNVHRCPACGAEVLPLGEAASSGTGISRARRPEVH